MNDLIKKEIQTFFSYFEVDVEIEKTIDEDVDIVIYEVSLPPSFIQKTENEIPDVGIHIKNILKKIVTHNYPDNNIIIDYDSKQLRTIKELKDKAELAAKRVLTYEKPYVFENLNPFERMIIHSYLKKHPQIQTHSEGQGNKRILIIHN